MREEPGITRESLKPSANRLADKVVIVTGSTSGIGKAAAILFAHEGAKAVVVGRRAEKGRAVVDQIESWGGEAIFVQADMTVDADVRRVVSTTPAGSSSNRRSRSHARIGTHSSTSTRIRTCA